MTRQVERLVASHLRFVVKIARSYRGWGLPMSDLVQEGTLGLVQAVRRFDPDRGVRLSTYAAWPVRAAIQEAVLRSWSVVRLGTSNAQKMLALKLKRMMAGMSSDQRDLPEDVAAGMAARFGVSVAEAVAVARRMAGVDRSLDQPAPRRAHWTPSPARRRARRPRSRRRVSNATWPGPWRPPWRRCRCASRW